VLDSYKFSNDDVIVPLPTIPRHKRERGFGHIEKMARIIAANSPARSQALLKRANNSVQVGASSEKRKQQAAMAYVLNGKIDPALHYFLLDDVWTTGSSMLAAAKILRSAGAQYVNAIVIAKTI
jgi:predicted amidophosphoribosyltransferase